MSIRYTRKRTDGGTTPIRSAAAGLLAISMMLGTALTGAITAPYAAYGADSNDSGTSPSASVDGVAGLCTPTTGTMGDSSGDINATDTGVATYVGGDMFVGKRSSDDAMRNNDGEHGGGPDGSYAAEIEGATVINGDLYAKPKKGFFTAGVVAFGSQFVPAQGTQVLTVGGHTSTTAKPASGSHAFAWKDSASPNLSNTSRSVVGISDNAKLQANGTATTDYTAAIAGNRYNLFGQYKDDTYSSVVAYGTSDRVSWNDDNNNHNPLSDITGLDNGADDSSANKTDFTLYGTYLTDLSNQMAGYKGTSEMKVTTSTLGNDNYVRYKYNWNNTKGEASYKFEFNNFNEKLITFHGDGKSALQVFTISADDLKTTNGQTGISYKFENIPDNTSVVINVTGKNVEFHNGWRFLWQAPGEDKATDLSNGYWNPGDSGTEAQKKAYEDYAERASKILWNFASAKNVTILGGQASGTMMPQNVVGGWLKDSPLATDDDPAAAMMGSILVPQGNFESHVSTNGRVWVGGDFSMYNPTAAHTPNDVTDKFVNSGGQITASVIDMDQERHNLPWSGNYTSQCAALEWTKVDAAETTKKLPGSSWAIYATKADAKAGTNPLKLVTDNEPIVDLNGTDGVIKVGGLNTNAVYYVKEIGAPQDYEPSDTIYKVKSGKEGTTVTVEYGTDAEFGTDGKVSNNANKVAPNGLIGNTKKGTSLTWKKTDENGKNLLAGSKWTLTKKGDTTQGTQDQSWTVTDNTVSANGLKIYRSTDTDNPITELTMNMTETVNLTTKVTPSAALQKVYWSSTTDNYKNILRIDLNNDGTSTAYAIGPGTVDAKVCTVSEANAANGTGVTKVCSNLKVTVTANIPEVKTFVVKQGSTEIPNGGKITAKKGTYLALTVTAQTADKKEVTPTFASSNTSVATIDSNGTISALAAGTSTITVTAGDQTRTFTLEVYEQDPVQYTYVFFPSSGEGDWGAANMRVHYGVAGSKDWQDSDYMTTATCDGNWKVARIPRVTADNVEFGFQRSDNDKAWYGKQGGDNFTFPANAEAVTVSGGAMTTGYPSSSSCSAVNPPSFANTASVASLTADEESADEPTANVLRAAAVQDAADKSDESAPVVAAEAQVDNTLDDVDSDAGEFTVIDLDEGTYWLTESGAPDGYTVNKTVYKITIEKDTNGVLQVKWEGGWPSIEKANANQDFYTNLQPGENNAISDRPTEITWYKVSSEDKNPNANTYLRNAQWKLILKAAGTGSTDTVYCVVDGNGEVKANTCDGEKLTDVSKTETTDGTTTVKNEADGIITLTGLKFGTYELKETVAPEGYDLSTTTYQFVIDQNSTDGTVKIKTTGDSPQEVTGNRITNKPGVELPATGGMGADVLVKWGLVVTLIALAGVAITARRCKQQ